MTCGRWLWGAAGLELVANGLAQELPPSAARVGAPADTDVRPNPAAVRFFETSVRPLLVEKCFDCHGRQRQRGGLRLDSEANLLQGGDNGPVVTAGKPDESP